MSRLGLLGVGSADPRRVDAVAHGVRGCGGLPLLVDATLRGVLSREGAPHARADRVGGSTFAHAYADKEATYGDLARSLQCMFTCVAAELGGRFDRNSCELVAALASGRAEGARVSVRQSLLAGWRRRLWGVLSVGLQRAVAESLAVTVEEAAEDAEWRRRWLQRAAGLDEPVDAVSVLELYREAPGVSGMPLRG